MFIKQYKNIIWTILHTFASQSMNWNLKAFVVSIRVCSRCWSFFFNKQYVGSVFKHCSHRVSIKFSRYDSIKLRNYTEILQNYLPTPTADDSKWHYKVPRFKVNKHRKRNLGGYGHVIKKNIFALNRHLGFLVISVKKALKKLTSYCIEIQTSTVS